jgi:hypothetical protein
MPLSKSVPMIDRFDRSVDRPGQPDQAVTARPDRRVARWRRAALVMAVIGGGLFVGVSGEPAHAATAQTVARGAVITLGVSTSNAAWNCGFGPTSRQYGTLQKGQMLTARMGSWRCPNPSNRNQYISLAAGLEHWWSASDGWTQGDYYLHVGVSTRAGSLTSCRTIARKTTLINQSVTSTFWEKTAFGERSDGTTCAGINIRVRMQIQEFLQAF